MHLLLLLTLNSAHATDYIRSVDDGSEIRVGGTWGRALAVDGGWKLAYAAGDQFNLMPLERADAGGWEGIRDDQITLSTMAESKDHCIKQCPDGTWLHTVSANITTPNDTAYAELYDTDFSTLASGVIEENEPDRAHNDMPCACNAVVRGAAFGSMIDFDNWFIEVGDDGNQADDPYVISGVTRVNGGAILWDEGTERLIMTGYDWEPDKLYILEFDRDFNQVAETTKDTLPEPYEGFWPQSLIQVGDLYIMAVMGRDMTEQPVNYENGDPFILVMDRDWNVLDTVQVADNPHQQGGMRPWLSRRGTTVLFAYDRSNAPWVYEIQLDADAFGIDPDGSDTGQNNDGGGAGDGGGIGGGGDDTGDDDDGDDSGKGCGCATGGVGAPAGLIVGLLAVGYRRRKRAV